MSDIKIWPNDNLIPTRPELECELARLKRDLVNVRRQNVKSLMIASDYQRENENLRQELRIEKERRGRTA